MRAESSDTVRRLAEGIAAAVADLESGGSLRSHAPSLERLVAEFSKDPGAAGPLEFVEALQTALRARSLSLPAIDRFPPSIGAFLEALDDAFADDGPLDLDAIAERLERAAATAFGGPTVSALRAHALRDQIRREVSESLSATLRAQGLVPAADMDDMDDDDDFEGASTAT